MQHPCIQAKTSAPAMFPFFALEEKKMSFRMQNLRNSKKMYLLVLPAFIFKNTLITRRSMKIFQKVFGNQIQIVTKNSNNNK